MPGSSELARDADQAPRPVPSIKSLIGRFSPAAHASSVRADRAAAAAERRALWAADAIHRANNLAQLATSLARVAPNLADAASPDDIAERAHGLARAYAELGADRGGGALPCGPLLVEIALRLGSIFGGGAIAVHCAAARMSLPADQRRALILIASELVINALKYAFPHKHDGTILVSLEPDGDHGLLTVADDGIGLAPGHPTGQGHMLIDGLAAVLGATIERDRGMHGGLHVTVRWPFHDIPSH